MPPPISDDSDGSTRFDLTKVIERTLSGVCTLVVNVGRTFFAFLFSRHFGWEIRDAVKGRSDTAWDAPESYVRPITYACIVSFVGVASSVMEDALSLREGKSPVDEGSDNLGRMYEWMLKGLEKGSVLGILEAMVPVLVNVILFAVGFSLAAGLFKQRLPFVAALAAAAYGVGTWCGLMVVTVVLRGVFDYLIFHDIPFIFLIAGIRRPLQVVLLGWTTFRFGVLLHKISPFSWRISIQVFVCGVAFVYSVLWLGSTVLHFQTTRLKERIERIR